jgi:hypothetical protein
MYYNPHHNSGGCFEAVILIVAIIILVVSITKIIETNSRKKQDKINNIIEYSPIREEFNNIEFMK